MRDCVRLLAAICLGAIAFGSSVKADVYMNGSLVRQPDVLNTLVGDQVPSASYWLLNNGNWGYAGVPFVQGNIYASNGGQYWLAENGNWGYAGNANVQGNIFYAPSQANRSQSRRHRSYHSSGPNGGGTYADDGQCGYFSIEGMSIKHCN